MAHFRSVATSSYGFDPDRNLIVLSTSGTCQLLLVAGQDLTVSVTPDTIAATNEGKFMPYEKQGTKLSDWEQQQALRKISVVGKNVGKAVLEAKLPDGRPWVKPIEVRVIASPEHRQASGPAAVTPEFKTELQGLSLRQAVIRVAEDQMNSATGRNPSGGDGKYYVEAGGKWCGGFAYWCWEVACSAKGVANPFGGKSVVLWSPEKAISWALQNKTKATVLRHQGPEQWGWDFDTGKVLPKDRAGGAKFVDIDARHPLQPGDVCLVHDTSTTWKHVCLVYESPTGDTVQTIDGNAADSVTAGPECIRKPQPQELNKKFADGTYKYAFVHLENIS